MAVVLTPAARRNYPECRRVFDAWFDAARPGFAREDMWVRLVGALDTESKCEILSHGGGWSGGNRTNSEQRRVLVTSAKVYRDATGRDPDGVGNNGGSVGPLQQIPTPVARLRTEGGMDGGKPLPWEGWGSILDCMVLETSLPKFLRQLRVGTDKEYLGKQMADGIDGAEIVVDLLNVQRPAKNEVEVNYGASIVRRSIEIAALYPRSTDEDWLTMATKDEYTAALREVVGGELKALRKEVAELRQELGTLGSVIRETYNRAEWTNVRTEQLDPVIRNTFNRADWTNTNVDRLLEAIEPKGDSK